MKVLLGCKVVGECASIEEISAISVKGLKNWVSRHYEGFDDAEVVVLQSPNDDVKKLFEDHIERLQERKGMKIVGVKHKPLRDFCYQVNDIRPLHICQSISSNMINYKAAIKRADEGWKDELIRDRIELYAEAFLKFNLKAIQVNSFLWGEFRHEVTGHKFLDYEYNKMSKKIERKANKVLLWKVRMSLQKRFETENVTFIKGNNEESVWDIIFLGRETRLIVDADRGEIISINQII